MLLGAGAHTKVLQSEMATLPKPSSPNVDAQQCIKASFGQGRSRDSLFIDPQKQEHDLASIYLGSTFPC